MTKIKQYLFTQVICGFKEMSNAERGMEVLRQQHLQKLVVREQGYTVKNNPFAQLKKKKEL